MSIILDFSLRETSDYSAFNMGVIDWRCIGEGKTFEAIPIKALQNDKRPVYVQHSCVSFMCTASNPT